MQISQQPLIDVLAARDVRYAIPVFQRVYSWNARQCEDLLADILRAGRTAEPHFMGMLLFSPDPDAPGGVRQVNVIDGQQRMTTMLLLLAALQLDGFEAAPLALSQMDRPTLDAVMAGDDLPEEPATRIVDNYLLFAEALEKPEFDLKALHAGIRLLEVASVMLDAQDSPQLVFESLNSKGMPLSTGDRLRNLLIASTSGIEQEKLYKGMWLPLGRKTGDVTEVLHAWLAESYRSRHLTDAGEVYGVLKACLRDEYGGSLAALLSDVDVYCDRYLADPAFRAEAKAEADAWIAGKPKDSVSELKLFGD